MVFGSTRLVGYAGTLLYDNPRRTAGATPARRDRSSIDRPAVALSRAARPGYRRRRLKGPPDSRNQTMTNEPVKLKALIREDPRRRSPEAAKLTWWRTVEFLRLNLA